MVHCGSVRQAAQVLQMTEMRPPGGAAIGHVRGVSLAPAVAAAAALLCPPASGAAQRTQWHSQTVGWREV